MRLLPIGVCLMLLGGVALRADVSDTMEPLSTAIQREPVNTAVPIFRAIVNVRSEKLTFLIPEDFRLGGDPARGRLEISNPDGNCIITFCILGPVPMEGLDASAYKNMLGIRYEGGRVTASGNASTPDGQTGPQFDVDWKGAANLAQKTRAAYVPTVAGVLELTVTSSAKNFSKAQAHFQEVLGTLRSSENGKLVIHHLAGSS